VQRLYELTKDKDVYVTTEVGQHQSVGRPALSLRRANRWMTSGGLGQWAMASPRHRRAIGAPKSSSRHPGEASILMCIQELSTAIQYRLP